MERKLKVRNSHSELMLNCSGKGFFFFFPQYGQSKGLLFKAPGGGKGGFGPQRGHELYVTQIPLHKAGTLEESYCQFKKNKINCIKRTERRQEAYVKKERSSKNLKP